MRVFKTKWFSRFVRKEGISDDQLCEAVGRAERGIVDADLGGGVIKQRLARKGKGRSGGYRTLIVFHRRDRAVFVYGFAKSMREDIDDDELRRLRRAAAEILVFSNATIQALMSDDQWAEVKCDGDEALSKQDR